MKKVIISIIATTTLIASCTATYFAGYHQGYNHVIHNQYAEECPDDPNCYHIVIDGNIHEYEADNNTTTISTTGTFTFYDYAYNFTSNDGTFTWSFDKNDLDFKPTAGKEYTLTYSNNGTADIYDDILISVMAAK